MSLASQNVRVIDDFFVHADFVENSLFVPFRMAYDPFKGVELARAFLLNQIHVTEGSKEFELKFAHDK